MSIEKKIGETFIETPINIIDQNPEQFYKSVKKLREDYKIIEEHIGVSIIPIGMNGTQMQMQPIHYCTALVKMTKEQHDSLQARMKLGVNAIN